VFCLGCVIIRCMNKKISNQNSLIQRDNFDLVQCFCIADDFFGLFEGFGSSSKSRTVGRKPTLSISEIATITILGGIYECKCLFGLYVLLRDKFSFDFTIPSYKSFVGLMNSRSKYLMAFVLSVCRFNSLSTGIITFCDSTKLEVCKIYREHSHRTMKQLATKSKSTTGWFYGVRLHLLCDREGNLMQIRFTTATTGERVVLSEFMDQIRDCVIVADAGYVSKDLNMKASKGGNTLLTAVRNNMKTLSTIWQNKCMNMRSRIETVFGVLKERCGLVTSLPRSVSGYFANYARALFRYLLVD
jgi:hypothetical protein